MVKKLVVLFFFCLAIFILCLFVIPSVYGEINQTAEVQSYAVLTRIPEDSWSFTGRTEASVSLKGQSGKNVKSELTIDAGLGESLSIDLSRAFIRVRFPLFRAALGKYRLSWGEGIFFNAGDILFGSTDLQVDLQSDIFRTEGKWLGAVNIPLGSFSFTEGVFLPPMPDSEAELTGDLLLPKIYHTIIGGRIAGEIGPLSLESGYIYNGKEDNHQAYFGLHTNLFFDIYSCGAVTIPAGTAEKEEIQESLRFSLGLFRLFYLPLDMTLSMRSEGILRPYQNWKPQEAGLLTDPALYGLLLYQDITFSPISSISLLARILISPIDLSALYALGGDWNIYQGLHITSFLILQAGGPTDLFALDRTGSFAGTIGFRFVF